MTETVYDAIVIGGGAAGLSAATTLSRARRSVLVIDAGQPRNAPAEGVHGFLTRDGMSPHELVRIGREEAAHYGTRFVDAAATSAQRIDSLFEVTADGTHRGRRLIIATGLIDELPEVAGLAERWGRDVVHCPYCHGWEVRDSAIGVLGTGPRAVHQALLFRQWSDNVTLLLNTAPEPTAEEAEQLAARGIRVVVGTVDSLVVEHDALAGVVLGDGTRHALQTLAVATRMVSRSQALEKLGLTVSEHPMGVGPYIETQPMGATEVPGVWVAGNATDLFAQVIAAAADGVRTAAAVNMDLIAEDVRVAVEASRAASS